jgi:hypothetical protein
VTSYGMGCRNFEAGRKNAFLIPGQLALRAAPKASPYQPPDSFHSFGADLDFDRLLSVAGYRHRLRPPRAFLEFPARGLIAPFILRQSFVPSPRHTLFSYFLR